MNKVEAKATATRMKGQIKESVGHVTGDRRMRAAGRAQKVKGKIQLAVERTKKTLRH
ncbi:MULTISPECIES: CsbD family protein [unclassified Streptomyces]|uniref:CsbD family protein n=1 Tax=unclassified Streptomyces TaxID=2593676 RepID=UPI002DDC150B|nr:CsbD family protein [Streptomyces sp. NBC_01750]WSB01985.1 CsbD family protein [Streptomyces sp. NBC_01794]WSD33747.1 CsbD family protein [Streptomyces sp. NBC_01750]